MFQRLQSKQNENPLEDFISAINSQQNAKKRFVSDLKEPSGRSILARFSAVLQDCQGSQ